MGCQGDEGGKGGVGCLGRVGGEVAKGGESAQGSLAWISAVSSSREVSGEKRLKALGDNAVWWRHESNVVIYEISHATFGTKTSLDKTVKFWWMSIIAASLSTVCKIYKNSLKLCIGPLVKLSIYSQYSRLAH